MATDPLTIKRAPAHACELAEFKRNLHHVKASADHSPEDARRPEYLWHYYKSLKAGDHVEIVGPKYLWILNLFVIDIDNVGQGVISREISLYDWRDVAKPAVDLSHAVIEMKGGKGKWTVVLGNETIKAGFATEADARLWLDERKSSVETKIAA